VLREIEMSDGFDLEERTALYGEAIIAFCRQVAADDVTAVLIRQLVRSGTSIGANYCEANDAETKRDFRHKIGLCRKESRETKHWLRMVVAAAPRQRDAARILWQEAKELNLIFSKIRRGIEK
jgi:four helix bundle protein